MKFPNAIFRQSAPIEDVHQLMNKFFINTKDYVSERLNVKEDFYFKIKNYCLTNDLHRIDSENRIIYVEFKEKYVIAGMLEISTAFNDSQFTSFRDLSCLEGKV